MKKLALTTICTLFAMNANATAVYTCFGGIGQIVEFKLSDESVYSYSTPEVCYERPNGEAKECYPGKLTFEIETKKVDFFARYDRTVIYEPFMAVRFNREGNFLIGNGYRNPIRIAIYNDEINSLNNYIVEINDPSQNPKNFKLRCVKASWSN
jgi:hypothetical protein